MEKKTFMRDLFEDRSISNTATTDNISSENTEDYNIKLTLNGVRFCLMGVFKTERSILKKRIFDLDGCKYIDLAKSTNVIVKGEKLSIKELQELKRFNHDGFIFPSISESELLDILDGRNNTFCFPEIKKDINITYDFIFKSSSSKPKKISTDGVTHILGCREIFVYNTKEDFILWQIIGNIGGVATKRFDPETTDYIMLSDTTVQTLKNGEKDEAIKFITKAYNNSNANKFRYNFILERDFMKFIKERSILVMDDVTLMLIEKYENN